MNLTEQRKLYKAMDKPMSKGGGNSKSNLRAVSRHTNRTKCSNTSN